MTDWIGTPISCSRWNGCVPAVPRYAIAGCSSSTIRKCQSAVIERRMFIKLQWCNSTIPVASCARSRRDSSISQRRKLLSVEMERHFHCSSCGGDPNFGSPVSVLDDYSFIGRRMSVQVGVRCRKLVDRWCDSQVSWLRPPFSG